MHSKFYIVSFLVLAGILTACSNMPSDYAHQMSVASRNYKSVLKGMTKSDVVATLGEPQTIQSSNVYAWSVRYDDQNYESLTVTFDDSERVQKTSRSWMRGTKSADSSVSRSFTNEK